MPCVHNDVKCRPGLNYEPEIMKAHYYYVDQFLPINFAFEKLKLSLLSLSYLFIYLPTDVISQEKKTATSFKSISKASKHAIPSKPTHKTCRGKAIFTHLVRRQHRTEMSSKSTATSPS